MMHLKRMYIYIIFISLPEGKKSQSPYAQPLNIVLSKSQRTTNKTRTRGRIRLKVRHTASAVKTGHDSSASSNKSLRHQTKVGCQQFKS